MKKIKILVFFQFFLLILTKYFGVITDETITIIINIIIITKYNCHYY